jgi:hypothetical protein
MVEITPLWRWFKAVNISKTFRIVLGREKTSYILI